MSTGVGPPAFGWIIAGAIVVPSDAPYGYEAGPEGVVVLEFRSRTSFGMQIPGGQLERWRRMAVVADENAEVWAERQAQLNG